MGSGTNALGCSLNQCLLPRMRISSTMEHQKQQLLPPAVVAMPFPMTTSAPPALEHRRRSLQIQVKKLQSTATENHSGPSPALVVERTSTSSNNVVTTQQFEDTIADLWQRMDFQLPVLHFGASTLESVLEYFASLNLSEELMHRITEFAPMGVNFADMIYASSSRADRIYCGTFTTYFFILDGLENLDDLVNFRYRLQNGLPQPNIILQHFTTFLQSTDKHFGRYGTDMIFKSVFDLVSASALELMPEVLNLDSPPKSATLFPTFFRHKTGISEAYGTFIFPEERMPEKKFLAQYLFAMPDLINMIDQVNDVFSFYKESVVGLERCNWIYNQANIHGVSPLEALQAACDNVIDNLRRARLTLSVNPALAKSLEEFTQGYIAWHMWNPRYRFAELKVASPGYATKVRED